MMKRICAFILVMISAASLLVGCNTPAPPPPVTEDEAVTLVMWGGGTQWKGDYAKLMNNFIKDFNDGKLGEAGVKLNITIDLQMQDNIETQISTSVISVEECPNLVIWDRFSTPTYAYQDYLQSIDSYIEDIDTKKFHTEAYKELNYYSKAAEGEYHQYGLPLDVDPWGVYVNMDIVTAHNAVLGNDTSNAKYVDPARLNNNWTWWDLLDIAKRLDGDTITAGKRVRGYSSKDMQQHFFKFMTSTGVDFLKEESGKLIANVQNQQGQDVLDFFNTLYNADLSMSNVEDIHFVNGSLAMLNQATYYGSYIKAFQEKDINYKFLPQPKYSGFTEGDTAVKSGAINAGMIGGFGLAIPKLAKKLLDNAAVAESYNSYVTRTMQFMKWWTYGEGAKYWAQYTNTLPALTALYEDETVMTTTVQKAAKDYVQNYKIRPNVRGFQDFQKNGINTNVEAFMKKAASGNTETERTKSLKSIADSATRYLKI